MKKLLIAFVFIASIGCWFTCNANSSIVSEATDSTYAQVALDLVKEDYNDATNNVLYYHSCVKDNAINIIIDPNPESNWFRKYIIYRVSFVPNLEIIESKSNQSIPNYELYRYDEDDKSVNQPHRAVGDDDSKPTTPIPVVSSNPTTYGIIISGGCYLNANYSRYYNDCKTFYDVLRYNYSVPRQNIVLCIADGPNPEHDISSLYNYATWSTPIYWNNDETQDLMYPATIAGIERAFGQLAKTMTVKDDLIIFVTDHGDSDAYTSQSVILTWTGEEDDFEILYPGELAMLISKINRRYVHVVMGQCYSGGFVDRLKTCCTTIATACAEDEVSFGRVRGYNDNTCFDEFLHHWSDAFVPRRDKSLPGDYNNDGYVTMKEAFEYAQRNDRYVNGVFNDSPSNTETPKYYEKTPLYSSKYGLFPRTSGGLSNSSEDELQGTTITQPNSNTLAVRLPHPLGKFDCTLQVRSLWTGDVIGNSKLESDVLDYEFSIPDSVGNCLTITIQTDEGEIVYRRKILTR